MSSTQPDTELSHAEWCRRMFESLREGGIWGVPRSGLMFRKDGDKLVLCAQMPHEESMPLDANELRTYQDADYEAIRWHFKVAGITVEREVAA